MGILFDPNKIFVGISQPIQLNKNSRTSFGNLTKADSFQNNSVTRYFDENVIRNLIAQNPTLSMLLASNKIPVRLNMKELEELKNGHCKDTQEICAKIAKNLPPSLKSDVDMAVLKDGAMLHDIGKVLIPPEILNKQGVLTKEEHDIMDLHSEIGYQLLKNTGINPNILNLVRYHHSVQKSKNYIPDINLEILNLADMYSALTEKRVYKDAYTPQQALTILYKDVQNGNIDSQVYYALVKSVSESDVKNNVKIS